MNIVVKIKRLYVLFKRIWNSQNLWNELYVEKQIKAVGRTKFYSDYARLIAVQCGDNLRVNKECQWGGVNAFLGQSRI